MRDFILSKADHVVQDDSGIPVGYFKRDQWSFQPFGRYLGPIAIFPGRHQNQLAEIYHRGPTKPIDWGMGYRWRNNESNVLLAVRKDIPAPEQLRPAISETPAVKPQPAEAAAPAAPAQAERRRRLPLRLRHRYRPRIRPLPRRLRRPLRPPMLRQSRRSRQMRRSNRTPRNKRGRLLSKQVLDESDTGGMIPRERCAGFT